MTDSLVGQLRLGAKVSTKDANHKFLRSLPPAWSNLAMTMRTKPDVDTLSIDDLYNNLRVFEQELTSTSKSSASAQNAAFVSHSKSITNKIYDMDIEEMDINWQIAMNAILMKKFYKKTGRRVQIDGNKPVGFDKKKLECFKCHNTGHFARECPSKGTNDGKKRDSFYQDQGAGKKEQNQNCLLTMDDGVVNWGEHTEEEVETNPELMVISSNNENKPLYSRFSKTDSFKGVPHPLTGNYTPEPQQEIAESLYVYGEKGPQKPEISDSYDNFNEHSTCQSYDNEGSFRNPSEHSSESESESISVPNEMSTSNSITSSEEVVSEPKPKEAEPSCVTHVKTPRQPMKNQGTPKVKGKNWNEMMERELGEGYSFIKKKCFVCGSLSHLIRDCDFYEKKMAREAELKKQRVFNTGNGVAKPVWNNANRVNRANHFVPRPVQLNAVRSNVNTVRANVNSVRQNVNSVRTNINTVRSKQPVPTNNTNSFSPVRPQVNKFNQRSHFSKSHSPVRRPIVRNTARMTYSHAVKGNWGTAVKTSAGYNWRRTRPNSNYNSGSNFVRTDHPLKNIEDRGIFDSGCSGHMTGNKDHLDNFEECKGGSVTFGGSKGYITGKGRIRVEINSGDESIIPSPKKGQREGKAVLEEKSLFLFSFFSLKMDKKQIREREASLAEIVRTASSRAELKYTRILNWKDQGCINCKRGAGRVRNCLENSQKEKMAQYKEAAKYYTEEDWDSVRAKLEANRDLSSKVLSIDFSSDDFAKKMVELINVNERGCDSVQEQR
ncbi:ribonuclease H-like domain-containing protein [Tanacetum coccineum]|uniref:Ribonuclease H-like domain-containing protein n=1 Tax=Tanacetum coccineum TaxID=301880 RepID=A0ABQ5GUH8_9ASTR